MEAFCERKRFPGNSGRRDVELLLDPKQVGAILGISSRTVNKLCNQKKLQYIQVDAKHRRFTREMVDAFIDRQTQQVVDYSYGGQVKTPQQVRRVEVDPGSAADLKAEMDEM